MIFRFDHGAHAWVIAMITKGRPSYEHEEPATSRRLVVLQECIKPLGLSITAAATALGVTRNTLSELVNGKRGISPEMAVRLAKAFGGTEDGWLVQQAHYELAQVRRDQIKVRRLHGA